MILKFELYQHIHVHVEIKNILTCQLEKKNMSTREEHANHDPIEEVLNEMKTRSEAVTR